MHHLKLSAYNSNVQRIKNRYKKKLKKVFTLYQIIEYTTVQTIKKDTKKKIKKI